MHKKIIFSIALVLAVGISGYYLKQHLTSTNAVVANPCIDMDADGYGVAVNPNCPFQELDCDDTNPLKNAGIPGSCDAGNANLNTNAVLTNDNANALGNANVNAAGNANVNSTDNTNVNAIANTNVNAVSNDDDNDGIVNAQDECGNTPASELNIPLFPTVEFGIGRNLLVNGIFSTMTKAGIIPSKFTLQQTRGCSCKQIIDFCGVGDKSEKDKDKNWDRDFWKKWSWFDGKKGVTKANYSNNGDKDDEHYGWDSGKNGNMEGQYKYGCSNGIVESWVKKTGKGFNGQCSIEDDDKWYGKSDKERKDEEKKSEQNKGKDNDKEKGKRN